MKTKSNMTVKQKPKEPVKRILNKKPSTGNNLKECLTCGHVKKSNPTPDGDEICPYCGGDCLDYEPKELDCEELWDWCCTEVYKLDNGKDVWKQINKVHQQLLTQQRTELLEEIEKKFIVKNTNPNTNKYERRGWNSCLKEIIFIIKEQKLGGQH